VLAIWYAGKPESADVICLLRNSARNRTHLLPPVLTPCSRQNAVELRPPVTYTCEVGRADLRCCGEDSKKEKEPAIGDCRPRVACFGGGGSTQHAK
jgi:hypothetical protein